MKTTLIAATAALALASATVRADEIYTPDPVVNINHYLDSGPITSAFFLDKTPSGAQAKFAPNAKAEGSRPVPLPRPDPRKAAAAK